MPLQAGRYRVSVHNHGFFRLDGGAMFGSVPKALWAREAPPDEENRILLATRSLVIEDGERKIMIDVGCGDKWSEKNRKIFCIEGEVYEPVPGVTDVLLTHLHFDHAGGVSRIVDGVLTPCYSEAQHYVSSANYENAQSPNVRERASYLAENVDILSQVKLTLTEDGQEIWPGITVHRSDGHTTGLQWVKISDGGMTLVYPADLCPTSKHLPIPFVMGYDMCAERAMEEKRAFFEQVVEGGWIVVFEHDPAISAGRVSFDERGRPVLAEVVDLG
ncbi:MAG TPA: MBL fold metallo-hydrolase, partial [Fimbriimonadaceae bacterium]|nr:MBL fold metallo-hydrolase [Fimbriimonadaceae bacterium]